MPPVTYANVLRVILLTGERGAGKTSFCLKLISRHRAAGLACGGIVCPGADAGASSTGGEKLGCLAQDAASTPAALPPSAQTDDEWELGSRVTALDGSRWKQWTFSAIAFEKANRLILASLERPAELTLIDEIGPLETELAVGFRPAWDALVSRCRLAGPGCRVEGCHLEPDGQGGEMLLESLTTAAGVPGRQANQAKTVLVTVRPDLAERLASWLVQGCD